MAEGSKADQDWQQELGDHGELSPRVEVPAEPVTPTPLTASIPSALQEFFIPVFQHIRLWPVERELIDHPALDRLANVYQLGQAYQVYRGATHKRIEHALGTLHVSQLIIDAIERNYHDARAKGKPLSDGEWLHDEPLTPPEIAFVRLGALLHDIGHLPVGHTFEDELGLLDKHDADVRLEHVLKRTVWRGKDERPLKELIDEKYTSFADASGTGRTPTEIFLDIVSKDRVEVHYADTVPFRLSVCRDLIGNTICADLLDYLHRDWYHIGKPKFFDARLLDYLEIRNKRDEPPSRTSLVVNVRSAHQVRPDAITAIFDLLESRYQLGEIALFHRTKLCAAAMLERLVSEIADASADPDWLKGKIDELLEYSDEEMVAFLESEGRRVASGAGAAAQKRLKTVLELARKLRYRQLHKQLYSRYAYDLPGRVGLVRKLYGGAEGSKNRLLTLRNLEEDFDLNPGSIVMYCPKKGVHAKEADVKVLVHGEIDKLANIEDRQIDPALTGGLLRGQQQRFERLWRVVFAIDPSAVKLLEERGTLLDLECAIRTLVLNDLDGSSSLEAEATNLAEKLRSNPKSKLFGTELAAPGEVAAKAKAVKTYSTGAQTIKSLLAVKDDQ